MYNDIIECIKFASEFLPCKTRATNNNRVVGWNRYCRDLYAKAREDFLRWHNNGKLRYGVDFCNMKNSRRCFKNALNYCKQNELKIRKENLLLNFSSRNKSKFWNSVSNIKGRKTQNFASIDGKTDKNDIISIFDVKYQNILNDQECQDRNVPHSSRTSTDFQYPFLFEEHIHDSILQLNNGLGWDGIHANHIKYSGSVFRRLLAKFLNLVLFHTHVPVNMLVGEIRPIIKNNALSKSDSNNFRPIMNSCMILKIFEYSLLPFLTKYIRLNSRQFGFRKHTGCLSAIALVKETIFHYNHEKSDVYCGMIDCSKAFDKINWKILLCKLSESDLPRVFVDIVLAMYDNSFVRTRFNGIHGEFWKVGNGTRQGGILSPYLFSVYINQILDEISNLYEGCSLEGYKTNILCYADDIICLSPSAKGLQVILDRTSEILKSLCLSVNPQKSNFTIFRHKTTRVVQPVNILLNDVCIEQVVSVKYLGVVLTNNNDLGPDIDRALSSFLKQFNSLYSKFSFVDRNVLYFLFKSFATSFYGMETWFEKIKQCDLNRISVAYHKAVKRVAGMNVWDSNHAACHVVGVPIFKHFVARRIICFWHKLINSKSESLSNLIYYFKHRSHIFAKISRFFLESYQVDISQNPLCAIIARIEFVQRNEPRSHYAY